MSKKGERAFHAYYESIYGPDRWRSTLFPALKGEGLKCALRNKYCQGIRGVDAWELPEEATITVLPLPPDCGVEGYICPSGFPPPPRDVQTKLAAYYLLDPASVGVALSLQVQRNHNVLDLCAAPGGKSVVLSQQLTAVGSLTCNEFDKTRKKRLQSVLQEHVGIEMMSKVSLTERDATRWFAPGKYDRVLVDAPCGAERHLVNTPGGLDSWSLDGSQRNAAVQGKILLQALETVRQDGLGRVVYATCSLCPLENDAVVQYVLSRTRSIVTLDTTTLPPFPEQAVATEGGGWLYLPDYGPLQGMGPMYMCSLVMGERWTPGGQEDEGAEDSTGESDNSSKVVKFK